MREITTYSRTAQVIALCQLAGVTPRQFAGLVDRLGDPAEILRADETRLKAVDGLTAEARRRIARAAARLPEAEEIVQRLNAQQVTPLTRLDEQYPPLLLELNDPPPLLYYRGRLPDPHTKTVALAGSEPTTAEGMEMTSRLAKTFARAGVQVVANLEGGHAAAAHLAARAAGGVSFAVSDRGFEHLTDTETVALADDIALAGGILCEYPPEQQFRKEAIGQSNRLVAGLAHAVVITEIYGDSERVRDLVKCCHEIGKLTFIMVDPELGAFADEAGLSEALQRGGIPIEGYDRVDDIIAALV